MFALKNLRVYYGESQILQDVSLEVPTGKLVCLMGRNRLVKTTLLINYNGRIKAPQQHYRLR